MLLRRGGSRSRRRERRSSASSTRRSPSDASRRPRRGLARRLCPPRPAATAACTPRPEKSALESDPDQRVFRLARDPDRARADSEGLSTRSNLEWLAYDLVGCRVDPQQRAVGRVRYPHGSAADRDRRRAVPDRDLARLARVWVDTGNRVAVEVRNPDGALADRDSERPAADLDRLADGLPRRPVEPRDRSVHRVRDPDHPVSDGDAPTGCTREGLRPDHDLLPKRLARPRIEPGT